MSEDKERTTTQQKIAKGNFKALYNKQYGDIVKIGQQHKYTPQQVFELAVRYFEWAESNAIKAAETAAFQGIVTENLVHKVRVFTINGLCLFGSFSQAALIKYRKEPGFAEVMEFIDSVIYEQKFQLAANGIVNASFIGKEIGIDKPVAVDQSTTISDVSTEKFKDAVKDILGEL